MGSCPFCRMISGEIPTQKVYEDEAAIVIRDIHPQAPVHLLAIPTKHYEAIHEVPPEDVTTISGLFRAVKNTIAQEELDRSGYRLVVNSGDIAGQAVPHIHIHILSGRKLHWPPG